MHLSQFIELSLKIYAVYGDQVTPQTIGLIKENLWYVSSLHFTFGCKLLAGKIYFSVHPKIQSNSYYVEVAHMFEENVILLFF